EAPAVISPDLVEMLPDEVNRNPADGGRLHGVVNGPVDLGYGRSFTQAGAETLEQGVEDLPAQLALVLALVGAPGADGSWVTGH
ncbi:MAG: hypothetical protein OXO51_04940, partial [Gemmatimonadota bacterium]|nr:hypothetical protein [Gemmatimonadota bacterium]